MQIRYGVAKAVLGPLIVAATLVSGESAQAVADCGFSAGDAAKGDGVYHTTCVACHGESGHGTVPGAPDFTKKGGVLSKSHRALTMHIKNGFHSPGKPLAMPPKGGNPSITDEDIKDVHAYLHHRFGCG